MRGASQRPPGSPAPGRGRRAGRAPATAGRIDGLASVTSAPASTAASGAVRPRYWLKPARSNSRVRWTNGSRSPKKAAHSSNWKSAEFSASGSSAVPGPAKRAAPPAAKATGSPPLGTRESSPVWLQTCQASWPSSATAKMPPEATTAPAGVSMRTSWVGSASPALTSKRPWTSLRWMRRIKSSSDCGKPSAAWRNWRISNFVSGATHTMAPGEHARHRRPSLPVCTTTPSPIAAPSNKSFKSVLPSWTGPANTRTCAWPVMAATTASPVGRAPCAPPAQVHAAATAAHRATRKTMLVLFMACTTFSIRNPSSSWPRPRKSSLRCSNSARPSRSRPSDPACIQPSGTEKAFSSGRWQPARSPAEALYCIKFTEE